MSSGSKPQASTQIMAKLESIEKRVEEMETKFSSILVEVFNKVSAIETKVAMGGSGSRAPRSSGSKTTTQSTPTEKKPPSNSLYYFKLIYKQDPEGTATKYFTASIKKSLAEHMENNSTAKAKTGPAKLEEEIKHVWDKFVKPKECTVLREKIRKDYDAYIEAWKKNNMTPASKDSESKSESEEPIDE